ncbi:MAG: TerB family tellurite resistance protein [Wenzhouxiangellaceae bacterium]|nr:TerB family tellurite resistance protein [Wenzhouxiangellaceae bacterium]
MRSYLDSLRQIIHRHEPETDPRSLPRAAAVLLIELALTDEGGDDEERRVLERAIRARFGLEADELSELVEEAARIQRDTHSLHEFTHQLRTGLDPAARGDLVEWLWRVAWADGRLDAHEEHLVRRLADLLGVPHREFIRRRHVVEGERAGDDA